MNADLAVPALVSSRARTAPNGLAVVDEQFSVTYGELEDRSNALCARLRALGLGPDAVVGVCLDRSVAQIISTLAVLKAGAAYLPLDPGQPSERLSHVLRDAGVEIVVTARDFPHQEALTGLCSIRVSGEGGSDYGPSDVGDLAPVELSDLAYVIYTSGSTGQPKGVEVTHAGLANLVAWHRVAFRVEAADRASHISAVGFDASVWEVWPYLTVGASVHIAGDAIARDPRALADWFDTQAITIAFVSSPMAERLLDLDYSPDVALRTMLTGADVLHRYPPASLPFALYNNYGPTEASVVATSGLVEPSSMEVDLPSIGRPIQNTDVYILDEDGTHQDPGVQGEICIAGAGLARGYRRRPDLTARKFVWIAVDGAPVRIYRTGDRGIRLSDGRIAFMGRIDDQVKIRGFRIEPREIEVAANAHRDVLESAVIVREFGPGDEHLIAYLVPKVGHSLNMRDIQASLATRLPAYMMPTKFVELAALPLTSNGKVDRAELRAREISAGSDAESFVSPRSATEEQLTQIIAPLLKLERVSIDDDFFKLGGHSLLGTQLIARVQDAFGVRISLRLLFESPTIAALAAVIERRVLDRIDAASAGPHSRQLEAERFTSPIPRRPV